MKTTLRKWQQEFKDISDLIVQASSMDCDDGWRPWSIGMSWQYVLNFTKGECLQLGSHENLVVCGVSIHTDQRRRPSPINRTSIVETLAKNGIYNCSIPHNEYYPLLPTYKFVISPEGNGVDCHRHYEALLAGCIPIIEKNPLTEEKYRGCPILWTVDYSEITPSYLQQKYNEMIDIEYDFSCLFLSSHDSETQTKIKESGNFWLQRIDHTRCIWYS
jgi:hypothetical protein